MRKSAGQHFFTVRGRGFTGRQWEKILTLAQEVAERSTEEGIRITVKADPRCLEVRPKGKGQPFMLWRQGDPDVACEIMTEGKFDLVVQSLLTGIKKIAPDILIMTSPDGRSYRRVLGAESAWKRVKEFDRTPRTKEEAFLHAMSRKKWPNPDTGNRVEFISLPKKEQSRLKRNWEQEFGHQWVEVREEAERKVDKAKKKVQEAGKAMDKLDKQQKRMEKAKGLGAKKAAVRDRLIRKAAIRVAHNTDNKELRHQILEALRDSSPKVASEKRPATAPSTKARLKAQANKINVSKVFPELKELAWKTTLAFARGNPASKTASVSTAARVAASDRLARKWLQATIENPHQTHEYLGLEKGAKIPEDKLHEGIARAHQQGDRSMLAALLIAKKLQALRA